MFDKIKAVRAARREAKSFAAEAAKLEEEEFLETVQLLHYWVFFFIDKSPSADSYQWFQIGWPGEMKLTREMIKEAHDNAKVGGMRRPIMTSVTYAGQMMKGAV